jgi:hypothetical protein
MNEGNKSDWGPVGLFSNSTADVAEIQNGRLAMMAIVGFAVRRVRDEDWSRSSNSHLFSSTK